MAGATKYLRADPRRWPGVYYYESEKRTFQGKPDRCYVIAFKVDGKKKWEKVGWKSEGYGPEVADEIRSSRVRKARHGEEVKTAKEIRHDRDLADRTINELADAYFKAKGSELKGLKTDLNRYEKHLRSVVGGFRASKLSPLDVARIRRAMEEKKPATVWNALELLRRILNFGRKARICPPLSFTIEMPVKDNEVTEYLDPEQAARFLEVLEHWPRQDVARMSKLAMFTGMRRGEVFKLEDRDADFHQGLIHLRGPKGKKTVSIPMNAIAREILTAQIQWRNEAHPGSPFLFPGRGGKRRTDSSAVERIRDAAGLAGFRPFHGLRHHFAVTLANNGMTLDMIGELLTHKKGTMATVTKRYAKYLPETKRQASELAAELLKGQALKPARQNVVNIRNGRSE